MNKPLNHYGAGLNNRTLEFKCDISKRKMFIFLFLFCSFEYTKKNGEGEEKKRRLKFRIDILLRVYVGINCMISKHFVSIRGIRTKREKTPYIRMTSSSYYDFVCYLNKDIITIIKSPFFFLFYLKRLIVLFRIEQKKKNEGASHKM